jgi:hypothetical protein
MKNTGISMDWKSIRENRGGKKRFCIYTLTLTTPVPSPGEKGGELCILHDIN